MECGFKQKELKKAIKQLAKGDRNKLLGDQTGENKYPEAILASARHHKLSTIPSILKNKFHLISNDPKFLKIFKQKPTANYQKIESLSDSF